ncbi:MAG: polysaccharide pyruvyl transferase family protein [Candidatus Polarisedimenticolaceae bacterium]|nr:polysaccharide pyruvyl transferase family protein [Candidatus Polarisedimenticolaceae bacterium]
MKKLSALHLASFNGNIGDNANHNGFYALMESIKNYKFEYTQLEIREFFWKKRFFDSAFVDYANGFDILIIGGGNYFELWVDHSPTGTSIMIEPELFKQIKVPVLFNALGVDPGSGASQEACEKFKHFLDVILADPKNMVSVRNDGALASICKYIGGKYLDQIHWTPDAGILVACDDDFLQMDKEYLAVNLAGDMLDVRFPDNITGGLSYSEFIEQFAEILLNTLYEGFVDEVVLIPHIYKDLGCINDLLGYFPDEIIRTKIVVAPLLHGKDSELKIFSIYKNAKITFAMRFHANLCSIGFGTPTIGLNSYIQIQQLYKELGISNYCVCVNKGNISDSLDAVLSIIKADFSKHRMRFCSISIKQKEHIAKYSKHINLWLNNQKLA